MPGPRIRQNVPAIEELDELHYTLLTTANGEVAHLSMHGLDAANGGGFRPLHSASWCVIFFPIVQTPRYRTLVMVAKPKDAQCERTCKCRGFMGWAREQLAGHSSVHSRQVIGTKVRSSQVRYLKVCKWRSGPSRALRWNVDWLVRRAPSLLTKPEHEPGGGAGAVGSEAFTRVPPSPRVHGATDVRVYGCTGVCTYGSVDVCHTA